MVGEVIAVLSGKGGTGKTSLCAGVAAALAECGKWVLCIDCDVGLRNLDISLGISELPALSFRDVSEGGYGFDRVTVHPAWPTLHFLTAPMTRCADEVDADAFRAMLRKARGLYDYILLDAPAGVEAGFRLAASNADRSILVTGADPASIRDAQRTADILELMERPGAKLVVNRVSPRLIESMALTIDDVMDTAGLPLLGLVPEDADVVLAAACGRPLLKQTRKGAAAACRRIANRIQNIPEPINLRK